ncbi:MAG: LLM class flavin-dependent oxidoreductase [Anaerolineae bacterium]|jgi:alkanesulfonate monooxygenase SsuD/methylene tetrahydromethanopterin reductase-like flavin-dependent oxidoreductase (luciferase family)|nr:LLM class flavin-dependent oxidoreductase [Anaerolineae bacterium]
MKEKSLGVIFHPAFAPETLWEYARKAEAAGFDQLWLWDDCFLPGALTSAAVALSATEHLKVGIGLIPSVAINPLFAAMEITTLSRNFPGRFIPGFGHGISGWMKQIGAKSRFSMAALEETVTTVRRLLQGEEVTFHGKQVNLDKVQMTIIPEVQPPLYIGGMRPKTLGLAGRIADGAIIPAYSSPAYVRWVREQIGNDNVRLVVYTAAFVHPDGELARRVMRQRLANWLPWGDIQLEALELVEDARLRLQKYGKHVVDHIPDGWLDDMTVSGTPQQAVEAIEKLYDAGADCVVLEPPHDAPEMLDAFIADLLPEIKR